MIPPFCVSSGGRAVDQLTRELSFWNCFEVSEVAIGSFLPDTCKSEISDV